MLAVVHPTYAIFLWIPFAGFVLVRFAWERVELREGGLALGALVVPAADTERLASALVSVGDRALREALGERARKVYLRSFSPRVVLPTLVGAYERAMAGARSVGRLPA